MPSTLVTIGSLIAIFAMFIGGAESSGVRALASFLGFLGLSLMATGIAVVLYVVHH